MANHNTLKETLGYYDYDSATGGRGVALTAGSANSGDIVVITSSFAYAKHANNPSATSKTDVNTSATVFIDKNVAIFGNGNTIDGNGYPVFDVGENANAKASITNLKISGGAYNAKLGGAVFVEGSADLTINNVTFTDCLAGGGGNINGGGGAIYVNNHGSSVLPKLTVTNSVFRRNRAPNGTGGAINSTNGNVSITGGSTFDGNEAVQGGAIGMKGSGSLTISGNNNVFTDNKATYAGGAVDIYHGAGLTVGGGGVRALNSSVVAALSGNSTFSGNTAGFGEVNSKDISYSRYYDSTFLDDSAAVPVWSGEASIYVNDLTFYDPYRTKLLGMEDATRAYNADDLAALKAIKADDAGSTVFAAINFEYPYNTTDPEWIANGVTWGGDADDLRVVELNIPNKNLTKLDASELTALTQIDCSGNNLTTLDVTGLLELSELLVGGNPALVTLSGLSTLSGLEVFNGSGANLSELDFTGLANLSSVQVGGNPNLTSVKISGPVAMDEINAFGCPSLETLDITGVESLDELDISDCPSLDEVIGLSGLRSVGEFKYSGNSLQVITATVDPNVENGTIEIFGRVLPAIFAGSDAAIKITPKIGYRLKSLSIGGGGEVDLDDVDISSDGTYYIYTYENVTGAFQVSAEFEPISDGDGGSGGGCDTGAAAALIASAAAVAVRRRKGR
ncbi:MAG: hypothetical protein LBS75_09335 [Synergistaceae bacterium]|nr:hypothetical protein [Synergistaceae bacterium]